MQNYSDNKRRELEISVTAKIFPTIYGYKIDRVSFEVSGPQEQENICNQRGEKLKGPCRWDDKCWDKRDQQRTNNPATDEYSEPGRTDA